MFRTISACLVLALVLSACGDSSSANPKDACLGKIDKIVGRMAGHIDTFCAAAGKAGSEDEFAAAISALAKEIKAGWAELRSLNAEMSKVEVTKAEVDAHLQKPLMAANERRDKALEVGCEKWAETDVVQKSLKELMSAESQ